jgi:hypothetical protein
MHDHSSSDGEASSPSISDQDPGLQKLWAERAQRRNHAPDDDRATVELDDERRARQHAQAPASSITGAKIDSNGAPQQAHTHERGHERGDRGPDQYFDSLRADTVKLSARVDRDELDDLRQWLLDRKREAQQGQSTVIEAHDGSTLTVADHSPSDNRKVLLEGDHGMEVTAVAQENVPFISFRFGASMCWNHSPAELVEWARKFCTFYGMEITGTLVSRLDLCVDVDERFYASDAQRFSGTHGGGMSVDYDRKDRPKMIYYPRTSSRDLTWRIYNKRKEVEDTSRQFWEHVWDAHQVEEGDPIWRVEYEAKRPCLRERGIDSWDELTSERIEAFWAYCTSRFSTMDRQVWERIQQASTQDEADRAEVGPTFDPERLTDQAAGCVRRIADELDVSVQAVAEAVAERAEGQS